MRNDVVERVEGASLNEWEMGEIGGNYATMFNISKSK